MTYRSKTHPCTCEHASQDKIHGKQVRVMNATKKSAGSKQTFRCTVCRKTHDL